MKLINIITVLMVFAMVYWNYVGVQVKVIECLLGVIILRMLYREIKEL